MQSHAGWSTGYLQATGARARPYGTWKSRKHPADDRRTAKPQSELLKKNLNQFLRYTHPDALRQHVLRESDQVQHQMDLQGILDKNEEAIQLLNSFLQTTSNYEQHRQDFLSRSAPTKLSFFIIRRKQEELAGDLIVKEITTTLRIPNLHDEEWMRKAGAMRKECLYQWRDSALLELLLQAQRVFRSLPDKKLSQCRLLPGEEQVSFLQKREALTKVKLPPQFSLLRQKEHERQQEQEQEKKMCDDDREKPAQESAFIDIPAGDIDSAFVRALRDDFRRSGTNRSDPSSLYSRKLGTRTEPTKEELQEILDATKVFFPPDTPAAHIQKIHERIKQYARELRIFEWYRLPIFVGAPTYSTTVKDGFISLPWNFTVKGTLKFLSENLEYVEHRHLSLRNKLVEVVEACETAREQLEVRYINSTQTVMYSELKQSLERLVAAKDEEEQFIDMRGVSLMFHSKAYEYKFDEVTGQLNLPVNWTWHGLQRALGCVKQDLIAFQSNYLMLPGLPGRLQEAGVRFKGFEVDDELSDCVTFQAHCLKKLVEQRGLFRQFDLSFLTIRISRDFKLDTRTLVLSIPWDFSVDELISYLERWQTPPCESKRAMQQIGVDV